jgi:small subunit ribosomal protein S17e
VQNFINEIFIPLDCGDIMGRIKTKLIKKVTLKLYEDYKDSFSKDFLKNRELVDNYLSMQNKKLKNKISGYITRLIKNRKY